MQVPGSHKIVSKSMFADTNCFQLSLQIVCFLPFPFVIEICKYAIFFNFPRKQNITILNHITGRITVQESAPLNTLHYRTLFRLCTGLITGKKCILLGLMPFCPKRQRTVCGLILLNPGIPTAVAVVTKIRFEDEIPTYSDIFQQS